MILQSREKIVHFVTFQNKPLNIHNFKMNECYSVLTNLPIFSYNYPFAYS